jgi:hypothetical protein
MAEDNKEKNLDSDILISALQFWKKIYETKDVIIRFQKKDGTMRSMRCTLDFSKIPKRDKPKSVNIENILKLIQKNKIMHVYDLEKKGWRSVPFDRVEYLDTPLKRYYTPRSAKKKGDHLKHDDPFKSNTRIRNR